jgi:hypothetical protein
MEAEGNLHTFHEFPENAPLAGADHVRYGLALMVERGTGWGPAAASSSERPMQAPESRPVQGMPSISGMSGLAAVVVNPCGELGTKKGVQEVVKTSSSSPESHAARGAECVGCATIAAAGAMAIAMANPPARITRRVVIGYVVIELPSVVVAELVGWILRTLKAVCRHSPCSLGMCLRRIRKSWGTLLRPSFVSAA